MSAQFIESQFFPPGAEPSEVYVWVQANNHEWAARFTGLALEEVAARYKAANDKGLILVIKLHWDDIKDTML